MFLTFLFRSAPEEGLYCKPKYRAKKFVFLKKQIYFSYSSFCCLFYQARHLRRWDQSAVNILYLTLVARFPALGTHYMMISRACARVTVFLLPVLMRSLHGFLRCDNFYSSIAPVITKSLCLFHKFCFVPRLPWARYSLLTKLLSG